MHVENKESMLKLFSVSYSSFRNFFILVVCHELWAHANEKSGL